jgi:uncharacterized protein
LLFAAALAAGMMNAVVGAGTLITFPVLLGLGVPPVVANVSNTIGLVPGSVTAAYGFRSTLVGRGKVLRQGLIAAGIGGTTGATLLLVLPSETFEFVIPPLLIMSGILAGIQPRVARAVALRRQRNDVAVGPGDPPTKLLLVIIGLTAVYGGYFGAAQGVILLAVLGVFIGGSMTELNGLKNLFAGMANVVSATLYIILADVDWNVVAVVAVASSIGGAIGGKYGRKVPSTLLRVLIVIVAFGVAAWRLRPG